jgi:hypothetical protein
MVLEPVSIHRRTCFRITIERTEPLRSALRFRLLLGDAAVGLEVARACVPAARGTECAEVAP